MYFFLGFKGSSWNAWYVPVLSFISKYVHIRQETSYLHSRIFSKSQYLTINSIFFCLFFVFYFIFISKIDVFCPFFYNFFFINYCFTFSLIINYSFRLYLYMLQFYYRLFQSHHLI